MRYKTIIVELDGEPVELEVYAECPLGARWWSWTEWAPFYIEDVGWIEGLPAREHRVLPIPLRYPEVLGGSHLVALEVGGFRVMSGHSMFPILNDEHAKEGAAAHYRQVVAAQANQPSLF